MRPLAVSAANLAMRRFAMIEGGPWFQLPPWRPGHAMTVPLRAAITCARWHRASRQSSTMMAKEPGLLQRVRAPVHKRAIVPKAAAG